MRNYFRILLLVLAFPVTAFANNYSVTINNTQYDFALGDSRLIKIGDQYVPVKIEQKESFDFISDSFSFVHSSKYKPATISLDNDVYQTIMMTENGSALLIQEYKKQNPSNLVDFMIQEITKEERSHGYEISESPKEMTLADGTFIKGKTIISKYRGADIKRYVLAYGKKESGLLIVSQIDRVYAGSDEEVINQFFQSLAITM